MPNILIKLAGYLAVLAFFMLFMLPRVQAAGYDPLNTACTGSTASGATESAAVCSAQGTSNNPIGGTGGIISKAAVLIGVIAGIGSVIMFVLGALAYGTSGGSPEKVTKAKARILGALIGLFIVAFAWAIVKFVEDKVIR